MRDAEVTEEEFATMVQDAAKERGIPPLSYDPKTFSLVGEAPHRLSLLLRNAYDEFKMAALDDCHTVIDSYLRLMASGDPLAGSEDWAAAQRHLMIVAFPREDPLVVLHHGVSPEPATASVVMGTHLTFQLAYDQPNAIAHLDRPAKSWGISTEEALRFAWENLRQRSQEAFVRIGPQTYLSPWRDNYDSAQLGLIDVIRMLPIRGRPVAMVPNRDHLVVTGSDDYAGLAHMAVIAHNVLRGPRPGSGHAYALAGDIWEPFLPPSDHVAHPVMRRLSLESMARSYHNQHEAILARWPDYFVASPMVGTSNSGEEVFSVSSYAHIPTLLPETDRVIFSRVDTIMKRVQNLGWAKWIAVRKALRGRLAPLGVYPERYRLDGEISQAEFAAMGLEEMVTF